MVPGIRGGVSGRPPAAKCLLIFAAAIFASIAVLPASAGAAVITPQVVKPEVVKPQAVTPPPAASPAPAPSPAPVPSQGAAPAPGTAPTHQSSPDATSVGDEPVSRPTPAPQGDGPPRPRPPDYKTEGEPSCLANNTDVEKRCKCDPAWCRFFNEQQAWNRWQQEHADDQSGEINAEKEAAAAADRAAAANKAAVNNPDSDVVGNFIESVKVVKELIEKSLAPLSAEQKCQCSIKDSGGPTGLTLDRSSNQSDLEPPQSVLATAAKEVADTVGEAAGGARKLFEEILFAAN